MNVSSLVPGRNIASLTLSCAGNRNWNAEHWLFDANGRHLALVGKVAIGFRSGAERIRYQSSYKRSYQSNLEIHAVGNTSTLREEVSREELEDRYSYGANSDWRRYRGKVANLPFEKAVAEIRRTKNNVLAPSEILEPDIDSLSIQECSVTGFCFQIQINRDSMWRC